MEKYEKPSMEVVDVQNEVITASCTPTDEVSGCGGFAYGGGSGGCTAEGGQPR